MGVKRGLGVLRVPPLNLDSKKLDLLVRALGPSYLRVGGSEADKIHYFRCEEDDSEALVLSRETWDTLHAFIQRNQLKFSFTLKYGLFKRKEHGDWQGTEIEELLQYTKEKNYRIDVCELGNELNAYWAFHGLSSQPGPRNLAQDYARFTQLIRSYFPDTKISGPGSAFWPKLGEAIKPFSNITEKFLQTIATDLDIVDWHFYPFQSKRSPIRTRPATNKTVVAARSFESFATYSEKLKKWRDQHQPQAEIWTGETGSAQCGGQPKISDRFASCFWWADQLGRGATLGQKVMIRQSLIGGDYGMIDRLTLKPRPDFWVSWLWVQLMGQDVYEIESSHKNIRAYCHKHPENNSLTLLLINISEFRTRINTEGFGQLLDVYTVTAKSLNAKKLKINGEKPRFQKGRVSLSNFPQPQATPFIPALSINFWCFDAF